MKISNIVNNKIKFQKTLKPKPLAQTTPNNDKELKASLDTLANQNKAMISSINTGFIPKELTQEEIERRKKELKNIKNTHGKCLFNNSIINEIARLDQDSYKRVLELANIKDAYKINVFSAPIIRDIAQFDDEKYQRALELANIKDDEGKNIFYGLEIKDIAQFDDEKYQRALELAKLRNNQGCSLYDGNEIKDIAQYDDNKYQKALELSDLRDKDGNCIFKDEAYKKMINCKSNLKYITMIQAVRKLNIDNPITNIIYNALQHDLGVSIDVIVYVDNEDTGVETQLLYEINPDGTITKERTEYYQDGTIINWGLNGNNSFIGYVQYINENDDEDDEGVQILNSQIEIIYDKKTKEPTAILVTKKSDVLMGAHEKTLYTLSDYKSSYDVLKAIKKGTIKGGKKLSYVEKSSDNSISYHESINSNGCTIKRDYTKGKNGIDYSYSFIITDENGVKILDNSILFIKNSPNKTTTVINGEIYTAWFDDETKTIKITTPEETGTINFNEISPHGKSNWNSIKNFPINLIIPLKFAYWDIAKATHSSYICPPIIPQMVFGNEIIYNINTDIGVVRVAQIYDEENKTFSFLSDNISKEKIYYNPKNSTLKINGKTIKLDNISEEELKTIPLYYLSVLLKEKASPKKISEYLSKSVQYITAYLYSKNSLSTIAHELGHMLDDMLGMLSQNQDLINIYNEEIAQFNSKYTNFSGKEYIDYFSQTGGSATTGLGEIVAEANMLLTTYGSDSVILTDRGQFLVQNFPKTIAYIATALDLNSIK